ncbi:MAG: tRNA 2-thiouridine(34) synthase MnmA [Holosporales bacterium]|jgi:tRNA-specific 2-thiouridylase|nr:tRNA 2-thiouridine(34) synthase MnmA [Holosporales bacterium]
MPFPSFCNVEKLPPESATVVHGISGGVDSSVTAALLKKRGCNVFAVFIELFSSKFVEKAKKDAMDVAKLVGVKFEVIDYKQQFHEHVIAPFVEFYCNGKTPLPCAWCNKFIKFSALCGVAERVSAQYVSTGHYVKTDVYQGVCTLEHAKDRKQDQSYFLHKIKPEQLAMAVFPLGDASKQQVRNYAEQIKLPVSQKKSEYDICFLADYDGNYIDYVKQYVKSHAELASGPSLFPGDILNPQGEKIGTHSGAIQYTIGQRKGLGVSAKNPLYVFKIQDQQVYVGEKDQLAVKDIQLSDVNFHEIAQFFLKKGEKNAVFAQFRSTTAAVPAIFEFTDSQYFVSFQEAQYGVSPGQGAVIRNEKGTVLAGGTII